MSRSCKECMHHNPDFIDKVCLHCNWSEFTEEPSNFKPKPATNADRIRSMSDEELAMWINDVTTDALSVLTLGSNRQTKSIFYWLNWLEQRVE